MLQTIVTVIVLLLAGAIVQTNVSMIHSQTPLVVPSAPGVAISYLRLFAGFGAAAVLVWLAGMLDLGILRAQMRRRVAAMRAMEQEMLRIKSVAYDQQQPILSDVRTRLEGVVQELRTMLGRVEVAIRAAPADRLAREDPTLVRSDRLREEVVDTPRGPVVRREEVVDTPEGQIVRREVSDPARDREEAAVRPAKAWPF